MREGDRRRELERAVNPFGEKPGLERAPKSRGWRRGSKPQGSRHLCGGAPLPAYFEALKVSPVGFARVGKAKREGAPPMRRCGPVSKGTGIRRRGFSGGIRCQGRPHLAQGVKVLWVAGPSLRVRTRVQGCNGPGRVEGPRRGRRRLRRGRKPGEHRPATEGQPEAAANGLDEGNKASK